MESLYEGGFKNIRDLNKVRANNIFADIAAERNGTAYIISVKARNRLTNKGELNKYYNILKINAVKDAKLKASGLSADQITLKLYQELNVIAIREEATPAWVTVPIDASSATFSAYFGLVSDLRLKKSIPMTPTAFAGYEALVANRYDARITPDLSNASD